MVLDFIQRFPSWGPERISRELARKGSLKIGHTAVYGIMKRRNL
ncbi:MAG: transposase, partial [Deltaproteobacteria bacterium]